MPSKRLDKKQKAVAGIRKVLSTFPSHVQLDILIEVTAEFRAGLKSEKLRRQCDSLLRSLRARRRRYTEARLRAAASLVFAPDSVDTFLDAPHPKFGEVSPRQAAKKDPSKVEEFLLALAHGHAQ